ncbi:transcription factor grauzone-like [Uranotaenia lowii]|uniref:transcription factor grauzone-like n=1 Tax=Uranotaenia lowii TaxID=190385 RepID=UPI00247A4CFF|nr:transcription factor grauzone-like [Uranotaenia lowii]
MDSNLVCRLCLYNNQNILPIFGDRQREVKLQEKLQQYLNLAVRETDSVSKYICLKCFQTVENFHTFYQEVAQNQTVFAYSTQPGVISVISDQESHTTYILREEEVDGVTCVSAPSQPCLQGNDDLNQSYQQQQLPSSSSSSVRVSSKATSSTITSKRHPPTGGKSLAASVDVSTVQVLASDLPSYDESQKSRQEQMIQITVQHPQHPHPSELDDIREGGMINSIQDEHGTLSGNLKIEQRHDETDETPEMELGEFDHDDDDCDDDEDEDEEEEHEEEYVYEEDEETSSETLSSTLQKVAFPKKFIQDHKLTVRGKELSSLMATFYNLQCELCGTGVKFVDMDSYLAHCKKEHGIKGYVYCCQKKIYKPQMMAMHMARHVQPEAFRCKECGKMLTTQKILLYHIQNHRPEEERPLKCEVCPRRFTYASALALHNEQHLPEDKRKTYHCDECGRSYHSVKKYSQHLQSAHSISEQVVYVCDICAKQFSSRGNLNYHLTTHQPKIHQVQCLECGKWLKNKLCLRKHMIQHSEVRHKCNQCDYSALNMQCLRNHVRVQHSDVKPFECTDCGKTFKLKNTLLNHMVQHTGVKKFSCEFCNRTFASSGNYYSHRKRMHPQELAIQKMRKEEEENEFRKKSILNKA